MSWLDNVFPSTRAFNKWSAAHRAWTAYENSGSLDDLNLSIALYAELVEAGFQGIIPRDRGPISNGYANALRARFQEQGSTADLDHAIDVETSLCLTLPGSGPFDRSDYMATLSEMHIERFEVLGDRTDLDVGERMARAALAVPELPGPRQATQAVALGRALIARFDADGDFECLADALDNFSRALTLCGAADRPLVLTNMAAVHFRRFNRTRSVDDLHEAIAINEQALDHLVGNPNAHALHLVNLGGLLVSRGETLLNRIDVEEGIRRIEQALSLIGSNAVLKSHILNNLGTAQQTLYDMSGKQSDLDRALSCKQASIEAAGGWGEATPLLKLSYASTMMVDARTNSAPNRVGQILRDIAAESSSRDSAKVVEAARRWQVWAASRQAWEEVLEAYQLCRAKIDQLVAIQALRPYKEDWLANMVGLSAQAAFALSRLGDDQSALACLDSSRAVLLDESLRTRRIALDRAAEAGHPELIRQYSEVVAGQDEGDMATLESLAQAARSVLGSSADEIHPATGPETCAYLCSTPTAGLAVIAHHDGTVETIELPGLDEQSWIGRIANYATLYSVAAQAGAIHAWRRELSEIGQWLWDNAIGDVVEAVLRRSVVDIPVVAMIPTGSIGLLPLHAAWTPDSTSPNGRRYLIDSVAPRYLLTRRVADRADETTSLSATVVRGPHLLGAEFDACAVESWIDDSKVLPVGAPLETVLTEMRGSHVLHFACHGTSSDNPRDSFLEVSESGGLRMEDILRCNLSHVRLAYLAACESAHYGQRVPDEVIGLPAAFLEAGASGVIASQWLVPSSAASEIAFRFFGQWTTKWKADPVRALRDAQIMTRDASVEEKARDLPWAGSLRLPKSSTGGPPHEDPYWWAGFQFIGY